jgi:hypothetical protein
MRFPPSRPIPSRFAAARKAGIEPFDDSQIDTAEKLLASPAGRDIPQWIAATVRQCVRHDGYGPITTINAECRRVNPQS